MVSRTQKRKLKCHHRVTRHGKPLEGGLGARGLHLPFGISEGSGVDLQVDKCSGWPDGGSCEGLQ